MIIQNTALVKLVTGKSLNMSEYIQPEEDTTLIMPNLTFGGNTGFVNLLLPSN